MLLIQIHFLVSDVFVIFIKEKKSTTGWKKTALNNNQYKHFDPPPSQHTNLLLW